MPTAYWNCLSARICALASSLCVSDNDGDISKLEFRVNIRKLGLSEAEATTQQIDKLFETYDINHNNTLQTNEMRTILQALKAAVGAERTQKASVLRNAAIYRRTSEAYRYASELTLGHEKETTEHERLKPGTPASRLGELLKTRNVKIAVIA